MSEPSATQRETGTCTFSSEDLDVSKVLLGMLDISEWNCSRPADDGERCIWHADTTEKSQEALASEIGEGDLYGVLAVNTDLSGLSFPDATELVDADLTDADLEGADLTGVNLGKADLTDASLGGADLTDADLEGADLTGVNLGKADLTDASLGGANLTDAFLLYADLTDAFLLNADLTDADLGGADLTDVFLREADLTDADLFDADLTNADLFQADLTDANLKYADLTDATIQQATVRFTNCARATALRTDFTDANLTGANFEHAILRDSFFDGVSLYGARLYDTKLRGLSINDQTTFSDQTVYDREADPCDKWHPIDRPPATPTELEDTDLENKFRFSLAVKTGQALKSRLQSQTSSSVALEDKIKQELTRFERYSELPLDRRRQIGDSLEKAISVYRTRQRLQRENSRPEDIPQPYVNEKHCRRRHAFVTGSHWDWMKYSGLRWVMCYGESPARVVGTSVVVISAFTIVYSLLGGVQISGSEADLIGNLYFSSITFSTLGYAGIEPVKTSTQLLASIQSLIGGILIALLVAVFGRRALR